MCFCTVELVIACCIFRLETVIFTFVKESMYEAICVYKYKHESMNAYSLKIFVEMHHSKCILKITNKPSILYLYIIVHTEIN